MGAQLNAGLPRRRHLRNNRWPDLYMRSGLFAFTSLGEGMRYTFRQARKSFQSSRTETPLASGLRHFPGISE